MNEATTFSLCFYVVYSKPRKSTQHNIHRCLPSWFFGIHWIFDFQIQFIMLDSISVDPHYIPIPYLQICQLTNVYLLFPNQSAWCFGVICTCIEWWEFCSIWCSCPQPRSNKTRLHPVLSLRMKTSTLSESI